MEEIEVKFLNIDPEAIQKKLAEIGAKKVGEYFYRRRVFDYPDWRLNTKGAWLRLRDEGEKITLTFKQRLGIEAHDGSANDGGMQEVEIIVSDFDRTAELLLALGFVEKFYQENTRVRWIKDNIEFDLDTWPGLNPYLEIETKSWEEVDHAIQLLGLNPADKKVFSTNQIYQLNGIDELSYKRIAFDGFVKR